MKFVCDAPGGKTWFALETEAEAEAEAALMRHAVDRYFKTERDKAVSSYAPPAGASFERDIGLKSHIGRVMPLFLTLRDGEGGGLATAMLPPRGEPSERFRVIIVGPGNADPYPEHADAIDALGAHYGYDLPRSECYPYRG
ncbi:MAG: hypothetical protein GC189_04045 [Alphaproteobacteria bacterium]|nr:hypothetical protein [Alphaproteobacteria bacterium]